MLQIDRDDTTHLLRILVIASGDKPLPELVDLMKYFEVSYSTAYRDRAIALAVRSHYTITPRSEKARKVANKKGRKQ
jgi:hypothetical protein